MKTNEPKVTEAVTISIRVKRFLQQQKDFDVRLGNEVISLFHCQQVKRSFLWFRWEIREECGIARINLKSPAKKWLMDVYGAGYFDQMRDIAVNLSAEFAVEIHVCLKSECPVFPDDY